MLQAALDAMPSELRSNPTEAGGDDPEWRRFLKSFRAHLSEEDLDADLLRSLARRKARSEALTPPTHYRYAWRLLSDVSTDSLAAIVGDVGPGVARRVTYRPRQGYDATSWTVDPDLFTGESLGFIDTSEGSDPPMGFVVVLRAPIHQQRARRFWLNPDLIYRLASATHFAHEREVVSMGDVARCDVAWEAAAGESVQELASRCVARVMALGAP